MNRTLKFFDFSDYNRATKVYWCGLMIFGVPILLWSVYECFSLSALQLCLLFLFAIFAFVAGVFPVRVPNVQVGVTASDAFIFLGLIYVGVPAAVLLSALDGFLCSVRLSKRPRAWLISAVISSICTVVAGFGFYALLDLSGGKINAPLQFQAVAVQWLIFALTVSALVYFLCNNLLISVLLGLKNRQNIFAFFASDSVGASWSALAGALAAGIIYETILQQNWLATLVSLPIIVLPYLAYRMYFRRINEVTREAVEASRLYMTAVEVLSNAVEAREQLTPGHVRRTQIYAVGLAKILSLPPEEIKALELASLLHGIGKLGVPDYILNKPSSLTAAEKERVKLHPLVGAELVESVAFPYPVADAVRFYCESWDGNGYPKGLRGEEIPITARILGIADAYDTIREDRPFRRAGTREDARRMLLAGAGTRFDPKLTDIFLRHLKNFEAEIKNAGLPLEGTNEEAAATVVIPNYLERIRRTNREVFALYELARTSSASLSLSQLLPFLSKKIQELVPSETCAIYLYDARRETATAAFTAGKNAAFLRNREVRLGEGAVGFAIKNERVINSVNPALDFRDDYAIIAEDYQTMAVLPLVTGKKTIGALAVYSEFLTTYDAEHLRLLEATANVAAEAIARTIQHAESETRALTDALTGLPNARSLQMHFEKEVSRSRRTAKPFQLIMCDLDGFKQVNDSFGHKIGDRMLCEIARILNSQLRDYDFLARYAGDEFVALVPEISSQRVAELCRRIEHIVAEFRLPVGGKGDFACVGISVGAASFPDEGETLDQLMVVADQKMYTAKAAHKRRQIELSSIDRNYEIISQSVN
jgi:diguanylate cyclase (GGDEF)-like protein